MSIAEREFIGALRHGLFVIIFSFGLPTIPIVKAQTGTAVGDSGIAYRTDYFGNDILGRDVEGGDWAACQAMCIAEPRCVVWTLYTPPPGTVGGCWLKHTKGVARVNEHSISGVRAVITSPSDTGEDPSAPSFLRQ